MPGFDGTGPRGMGPMTGGGRGFCSPWGRGAAYRPYGFGPGYGYGRAYYGAGQFAPFQAPFSPEANKEEELDWLRRQSQGIKGQLEQIEARIKQLEKSPGTSTGEQ